jgi:NAD(P)-dependent dehydrogenase (short-subunit alcohol dehydrogenase family)
MTNLFDLTGKTALLIGYTGNLGPIWQHTLESAGCLVHGIGLPEYDFSVQGTHLRLPINPNIIVCNAAIDTPPTKTEARFFDAFERTMQVNVNAHARILEEIIPDMIHNGGGVIVFIGSIMGYIGADWRNYSGGFEKPCAYNASKAALKQLARSITVQYGRCNIRAVCPGFGPYISGKLDKEFLAKITGKIPMQRTVSRESLQQTLLYACCCQGLAGEDWLVDGGYTKW